MIPLIVTYKINPSPTYVSIREGTFIILLLTLAAIFVALASQQAAYVNQLYTLIKKYKHRNRYKYRYKFKCKKDMPASFAAAYSLVAAGFWAFSFAVLVVLGFIGQLCLPNGSRSEPPNNIYGPYEWAIALLFIGGWVALIAGALRRFPGHEDI